MAIGSSFSQHFAKVVRQGEAAGQSLKGIHFKKIVDPSLNPARDPRLDEAGALTLDGRRLKAEEA